MKTRNIKTSFWKDSKITELSFSAKSLFMYLITNEHIGLTGVYELPDKFILVETGMTQEELQDAKQELMSCDRVRFFEGWIVIMNAQKHNRYNASEMNKDAFLRESLLVPENVINSLNIAKDNTGIYTGVTAVSIPTSNKKLEISNKKLESKGGLGGNDRTHL